MGSVFPRCYAAVALCLAITHPAAAHMGFHEEIEELTARMVSDPGNAELCLRRGDLYRQHQEWDLARTDLDRARQIDPKLATIDLYQGKLFLHMGELGKARQALDTFLKAGTHSIEGYVTRAKIYDALGKHRQAAADYDRAILEYKEPNKPFPEYYIDRSRALMAAGNQYLDVALQGLDEGMRVLGSIITLDLYALELEIQGGRYDAALARIDRITAAANRKESWLIRRGEVLEQMGRSEEAFAAYEAADEAIASLPRRIRETRALRGLKHKSEEAKRGLRREGYN